MPKITSSINGIAPRPSIVSMAPYHPPSSGRARKIRLDFNENTVGCSPRVIRRLRAIKPDQLAMYPEYNEALPKFAAHFGVNPDQLTLTNGTDEAIQLVVNTYVSAGDAAVVLRPTYAMYKFYSQVAGARVEEVDYLPDLGFPEEALLAAIKVAKAVFIANPNNPTGTSATPGQLKRILESASHAAVMIDEAYFEFFGQTALPWIGQYKNLFVSRTFSKAYGLAAFRLGCLFSNAENMEKIRKGQSPYSVNAVAVMCGLEAIRDRGFVKKYVSEAIRSRQMLTAELDRLGWSYFPSDANFVLVRFGGSASQVLSRLRENGVLVRDRRYEIEGCVRITAGTVAQTKKLISLLRKIRADVTSSSSKQEASSAKRSRAIHAGA